MLPISDQLHIALKKLIGDNLYETWLDAPNLRFDLKTPRDLFSKKEYNLLWSLVHESKTSSA